MITITWGVINTGSVKNIEIIYAGYTVAGTLNLSKCSSLKPVFITPQVIVIMAISNLAFCAS